MSPSPEPLREVGRRYVGICYEGGWGNDLTGHLVGEYPDGWKVAASHISSDSSWSEHDIRRHFERRDEPSPADTFEWAGRLTVPEIEERFDWTAATPPSQEVENRDETR